jgi:hypothetical protein
MFHPPSPGFGCRVKNNPVTGCRVRRNRPGGVGIRSMPNRKPEHRRRRFHHRYFQCHMGNPGRPKGIGPPRTKMRRCTPGRPHHRFSPRRTGNSGCPLDIPVRSVRIAGTILLTHRAEGHTLAEAIADFRFFAGGPFATSVHPPCIDGTRIGLRWGSSIQWQAGVGRHFDATVLPGGPGICCTICVCGFIRPAPTAGGGQDGHAHT